MDIIIIIGAYDTNKKCSILTSVRLSANIGSRFIYSSYKTHSYEYLEDEKLALVPIIYQDITY